jgi:DNA-binding MarR family transcriptional regulator
MAGAAETARRSSGAGEPDDIRTALDAFRRIVQTLRTSARDVERRGGISGAQLFALQQIAAAPGASVNELAARTFTHQSSVSVVVQRLVKRRLVAKVSGPTDKRRAHLAVTSEGAAVLRRAPDPVQARLVAAIEALSAPRRRMLAEMLSEIARTMNAPERARMFFEDAGRRARTRR